MPCGRPHGTRRPLPSIERVLSRSLTHIGTYDEEQLVGFINIAWDGGIHAFILDTCVHPEFRHRGIASQLIHQAINIARERGMHWLHVDYEPHLESLYQGCGFRATKAGLIELNAEQHTE